VDRRFGASQLRVVRRALGTAEDLTARFYRIPGREWPRFPYDVRTRAVDPGPTDGAFADLVRIRCERPGAIPDRFRIRLADEAILDAADADGPPLYPLLLYVLAHELIHVVRFGEGRAEWDASGALRREEERRVHAITRKVVGPSTTPGLDRVAVLYERHLDAMAGGALSPK